MSKQYVEALTVQVRDKKSGDIKDVTLAKDAVKVTADELHTSGTKFEMYLRRFANNLLFNNLSKDILYLLNAMVEGISSRFDKELKREVRTINVKTDLDEQARETYAMLEQAQKNLGNAFKTCVMYACNKNADGSYSFNEDYLLGVVRESLNGITNKKGEKIGKSPKDLMLSGVASYVKEANGIASKASNTVNISKDLYLACEEVRGYEFYSVPQGKLTPADIKKLKEKYIEAGSILEDIEASLPKPKATS
jgi:hypothetical protein